MIKIQVINNTIPMLIILIFIGEIALLYNILEINKIKIIHISIVFKAEEKTT